MQEQEQQEQSEEEEDKEQEQEIVRKEEPSNLEEFMLNLGSNASCCVSYGSCSLW